jgi:hypothetical protein
MSSKEEATKIVLLALQEAVVSEYVKLRQQGIAIDLANERWIVRLTLDPSYKEKRQQDKARAYARAKAVLRENHKGEYTYYYNQVSDSRPDKSTGLGRGRRQSLADAMLRKKYPEEWLRIRGGDNA